MSFLVSSRRTESRAAPADLNIAEEMKFVIWDWAPCSEKSFPLHTASQPKCNLICARIPQRSLMPSPWFSACPPSNSHPPCTEPTCSQTPRVVGSWNRWSLGFLSPSLSPFSYLSFSVMQEERPRFPLWVLVSCVDCAAPSSTIFCCGSTYYSPPLRVKSGSKSGFLFMEIHPPASCGIH